MNMCTKFNGNWFNSYHYISLETTNQPHGGAGGKVIGSLKSSMSIVLIHPFDIEIFHWINENFGQLVVRKSPKLRLWSGDHESHYKWCLGQSGGLTAFLEPHHEYEITICGCQHEHDLTSSNLMRVFCDNHLYWAGIRVMSSFTFDISTKQLPWPTASAPRENPCTVPKMYLLCFDW